MPLSLILHTAPSVPLEAEVISPEKVTGLSELEIAALTVHHGNQRATLGDFFTISGKGSPDLHLEGDLSRVKHIGAGMTAGSIHIDGHVGAHVGAGMHGGEIIVAGNAGDWVGPEMQGGRIIIKGNAGHLVGAVYRGGDIGMRGGSIIIHGNVRNELGNAMRGGLIAVAGESGDFTGVNLRAGSIFVLGQLGARPGAGMRRGTIVSMRDALMLPTFTYSCSYRPSFLHLYLLQLKHLGLPLSDAQLHGTYSKWCGDAVELNRGEILLLDA